MNEMCPFINKNAIPNNNQLITENIVNSVPNSVLTYVLGRVKMNPIVALQSCQN